MNEVHALPSFDVPKAKHMDRIIGRFQARVTRLMGSANGTGGTLAPATGLVPGLYVAVLNGEELRIGSFKFELAR